MISPSSSQDGAEFHQRLWSRTSDPAQLPGLPDLCGSPHCAQPLPALSGQAWCVGRRNPRVQSSSMACTRACQGQFRSMLLRERQRPCQRRLKGLIELLRERLNLSEKIVSYRFPVGRPDRPMRCRNALLLVSATAHQPFYIAGRRVSVSTD